MVDRRPETADGSRTKRQKMDKTETDPRDNPYLAHMYPDETSSGNLWDDGIAEKNPAFAKLKRHRTTAKLAKAVEDSEVNPFNGQQFSTKYFSILEGRRDLPVHAQRYVLVLLYFAGKR